jgi:ABC-type multidrug transport system permease subunit
MATYNLPYETSYNFSKGIDQIFLYLASEIPILIPLILFSFFMIVALTGFFLEERRRGEGDFSLWLAIAGLLTTVLASTMQAISGMVSKYVMGIVIGVAILTFIFYIATRRN